MYGHSRFEDPIERNALVRCLFDKNFHRIFGDGTRATALTRGRNVSAQLFQAASESVRRCGLREIKMDSLFQWAWNRRVVAGELSDDNLMVRNHPLAGRIAVCAVDLSIPTQPDLLVRALVPADQETASNFRRLETVDDGKLRGNEPLAL